MYFVCVTLTLTPKSVINKSITATPRFIKNTIINDEVTINWLYCPLKD